LHLGQIGDAAATNGSRGPASTLSFILTSLQRQATIPREDVPNAAIWILDKARLSGDVSSPNASSERAAPPNAGADLIARF
jgi:hypothetical protein